MHTEALHLFMWSSRTLAKKKSCRHNSVKDFGSAWRVYVCMQSLAAYQFGNSHELKDQVKSEVHSWRKVPRHFHRCPRHDAHVSSLHPSLGARVFMHPSFSLSLVNIM